MAAQCYALSLSLEMDQLKSGARELTYRFHISQQQLLIQLLDLLLYDFFLYLYLLPDPILLMLAKLLVVRTRWLILLLQEMLDRVLTNLTLPKIFTLPRGVDLATIRDF